MTSQQVADRLGVSDSRVRQLVGAMKLPRPLKLGSRLQLFNRADIEAYLSDAAQTVVASAVPAAPAPLELIIDEVVWRSSWAPTLGGGDMPLHVRIYRGEVNGEERTVVLLAEPVGTDGIRVLIGQAEQIVGGVAERYLDGQPHRAAWVHVWPAPTHGPWQEAWSTNVELSNIILSRHNSARPGPDTWYASWSTMSLQDLDHLIGGASVDWFEWGSYTPDLIAQWQRTARPIEVVYDPYGMQPYLDAFAELKTSGHQEAPLARQCLLVELALRHNSQRSLMKLRGQPDALPMPGDSDESRPSGHGVEEPPVNTTAPVPFQLDPGVVEQLPDLDALPGTFADRVLERRRLFAWRDSIDKYGDHPQLHLVENVVDKVLAAQADWAVLTDRDRGHHIDQHCGPTARRRILDPQLGPWGDQYYDGITWRPGDPREDQQLTPQERREARQLEGGFYASHGYECTWGTDKFGNAVMEANNPRDERLRRLMVMWPDHYDAHPLPSDVHIVADGAAGDLPVYIARRGSLIGLLPFNPRGGQWNFGYGGGGPGALVAAVEDFLEKDGLPRGAARAELEQIIQSPPEDALDIDLDAVLARASQERS